MFKGWSALHRDFERQVLAFWLLGVPPFHWCQDHSEAGKLLGDHFVNSM